MYALCNALQEAARLFAERLGREEVAKAATERRAQQVLETAAPCFVPEAAALCVERCRLQSPYVTGGCNSM